MKREHVISDGDYAAWKTDGSPRNGGGSIKGNAYVAIR